MSGLTIKNTLTKGLRRYFNLAGIEKGRTSGADKQAKIVVASSLLNWTVNGSINEPVVPPIMTGQLRGSGSVFVGSELIHTTKGEYAQGTPNLSHNDNVNVITVGFNTSYAVKMHETKWIAGGKIPSKQVKNNPNIIGDVGNKFLERHLIADGKDLIKLYAKILKKETNG